MDQLSLAAFEERAAAAETRLAALEAAVASGVTNSGALLELRSVLVQAKAETAKLQEERDKAVSERKAFEEEAAKLRYQVMHLKRAVRELESKQQ